MTKKSVDPMDSLTLFNRVRSEILLAVLGLILSALFMAHLQGCFHVQGRTIAHLSYATGLVRRLASVQLTWDRVQNGGSFSMGDTISTAEESFATITFIAGAELTLNPGSLVKLKPVGQKVEFTFLQGGGRLRVNRASREQWSVPQGVDLEVVESLSEQRKPASILPTLGKELASRERYGLAPSSGLLSSKDFPEVPVIYEPADDTFVDFNLVKQLSLRYGVPNSTSAQGGQSYEILFRSSEDNQIESMKSEADIFQLGSKSLPTGLYHWSVRVVNAQGERSRSSSSRKLRVKSHVQAREPATYRPVFDDGG